MSFLKDQFKRFDPFAEVSNLYVSKARIALFVFEIVRVLSLLLFEVYLPFPGKKMSRRQFKKFLPNLRQKAFDLLSRRTPSLQVSLMLPYQQNSSNFLDFLL